MSSAVLNSLKKVKERIGHNYTSYQLLTILDRLLLRALKPVIETTDFFDRIIACVIGWAATNPRRKLSALPREKFNTYVMAYLASSDPELKYRIVRKMKLERNILFFVLARFHELTLRLDHTRPDQKLIRTLKVTAPNKLWFAARTSKYWWKQAEEFKHMMMEKYFRLVMLETTIYCKTQKRDNPHLVINVDDVAQNFVLAVSKAIDKCDAEQGTLTSYVQNWIKDAKSTSHYRHEYGIAYTIPASRRRQLAESNKTHAINLSVSFDSEELKELESDTNIEEETIRKDTVNMVRRLAKLADPSGVSRLFLGIGESLTADELLQLSAITVN